MNPVTDHPLFLPQTTLSHGCGSQIREELSFGEGHRPFYHLLKTPFGDIPHVAQLGATHLFGVW